MKLRVTVMLAMFLGCGGKIPPPPPPPTPQPTPPSSLAPIQIVNGAFVPRLRMCIHCCCCLPANDVAKGWTLCPPEMAKAYQAGGQCNATHVRVGPFSDQNWGWGLIERVRANVESNASFGLYTEVDLIDCWALDHQQPNLYGDTLQITKAPPDEHYRQLIRETVRRTCDLPVLYNMGNECFKGGGASPAWEDAIYSLVKQSMRDFGCPDRPVGTTHRLNALQPGRKLYDYVTEHGWGVPLPVADVGTGRKVPVMLTESDNQLHSPAEYRSLRQQTEANPTTEFGWWRGPLADAEWNAVLGTTVQYRPQCETPSTCLLVYPRDYAATRSSIGPGFGAHFRSGEQGPYFGYRSQRLAKHTLRTREADSSIPLDETTLQVLATAIEQVIVMRPWLFGNTADPSNTFLAVNDERYRIGFYSSLQGFIPRCTEIGDPSKPWNGRDSVDILTTAGSCPQDGIYNGYHPLIWGGGRVVRGEALRNVFNGAGRWIYSGTDDGCHGTDCGPAPAPTPAPTPPPPACAASLSDVTKWRVIVKPNHANQQLDVTPVACGPIVSDPTVHNCGTNCCELSAEKGNAACSDRLYGQPFWTDQHGLDLAHSTTPRLVQVNQQHSFTVKVAEGQGVVSVCGKDARSCVSLQARASSPACDLVTPPPGVPGQGCVTP